MVRPHLEYVDFIVESGSKFWISKLDRLQERALRRIEYCKKPENRKKYCELEKEYNIENLTTRRKRNLIRYMYQQSQIEMNKVNTQCDKNLRSKKKIMLRYNFSNLTKLHNSPFYRGVEIWNTLPESVQKCQSKHEFKKMVKRLKI